MSPPCREGSESGRSSTSYVERLTEHALRERTSSVGTPESHSSCSVRVQSMLNMEGPDDQESIASQELSASRSTSDSSPSSCEGPNTPGHVFRRISSTSSSPVMANSRPKLPTTVGQNRSLAPAILGAPTGEINARKSPFLPSAMSSAEIQHAEPTAGPHVRSNGLPSPTLSRTIHPLSHSAVARIGGRRDSDTRSHFIPSQSNSPTTSYCSFGVPGRVTPPAPWANSHQLPTQLPSLSSAVAPHISIDGDAAYGSGPSSVHNGVQMMTYYTNNGPTQIPVDVQAASKEADEKRKRNAGASARFRARRKEKEREASTMIAKLEGEVRKMSEERDSYRVERDYYRAIVQTHVHPGVVPRAPSPRTRRPSSSRSTSESPDWQQQGERGSDDSRNQRRRLSGYYDSHAGSNPSSVSPSEYAAGAGFGYPRPDRAHAPPSSHFSAAQTATGYEGGWAHTRA